jgi:hypothetical protein
MHFYALACYVGRVRCISLSAVKCGNIPVVTLSNMKSVSDPIKYILLQNLEICHVSVRLFV